MISFEEAEREAAQVAAEGIRTIKIKVGVDAERDAEIVKRIRDTVGPKIALCIDANQGYATPGEAIRVYRRIEACDIEYFEQPVEGISRLAQVARAIDVPVMADESAWNAHDVLDIVEKRAAQIVSIYTTKPGGPCALGFLVLLSVRKSPTIWRVCCGASRTERSAPDLRRVTALPWVQCLLWGSPSNEIRSPP